MEYIEHFSFDPDHFIAGGYPIASDPEKAAGEDGIKRYAPVMIKDGKIMKLASKEALTSGESGDLYGIAMNDAKNGEPVVVWCTGEFFADALVLEEGVTLDDVRVPLRKLNIFLKS